MDWKELKEQINAQLESKKASPRVLGQIEIDGDAVLLGTTDPGTHLIVFDKEKMVGVTVVGNAKEGYLTALLIFSALIDVKMQVTEKRRNKYLERLNLFNGKLNNKGSNLRTGDWSVARIPLLFRWV